MMGDHLLGLLFHNIQQDVKITLLAPILCAIFRFIFIKWYGPGYDLSKDGKKLYHSFRYGFWWGLDFNAYVLLVSFVLVTIPSLFVPAYAAWGDTIRALGVTLYALVIYMAFLGKMIFYNHFRDIYNPLVRLGANADKMNFLDIFIHKHHGLWLLASLPLYGLGVYYLMSQWLALPTVALPIAATVTNTSAIGNATITEPSMVTLTMAGATINVSPIAYEFLMYGLAAILFLGAILLFYFLRFGGTLQHRNKPEWDEVPALVKADLFLAKATVDDLVALEMVYKKDLQAVLGHSDEEARQVLRALPELAYMDEAMTNPLEAFKRVAKGPRISKPQHIFIMVGESYTQSMVDPVYKEYHVADRGKAFKEQATTMTVDNFLPAGRVSQPAVTSLLAGIYDCDLEINEKPILWENGLSTSLPEQFKALGYRTELWYGGSLSWASLGNFGQAMGFDACHGGPDICGPQAPHTWLGVYDHIFLDQVAQEIESREDDRPTVHFIYTTSNHAPTTIPIEKYGWNPDTILGHIPASIREQTGRLADLGTYWYAEQALFDFVDRMRTWDPQNLTVVTGDHSYGLANGLLDYRSQTLRENYCTYFAMAHPELEASWANRQGIGDHMQILPTIIELIAPQGHVYQSLKPSLLEEIDHLVSPYHWLTKTEIGYYDDQMAQSLLWRDRGDKTAPELAANRKDFEGQKDAYMELTGWILRHPELLIPRKL